jgi:N-acetylmuramoyl-L-alanine amidase
MKLYEVIQTKNAGYIRARPIKPIGIFVHSTGATNPELRRYVDAPDVLGFNTHDNHWNRTSANKSMHGFIGLDKTGEVAVCHTLPYNIACWGAGGGSRGSYNYDPQAHVQFEVCEDNVPRSGKAPTLKETAYYHAAWLAAEEYCAYLCQLLNLPASSIVGHYEAAKRGFASYHSDPEPWMKKFGDSMDKFRARVAERLNSMKINIKLTRQENADFHKVKVGDVIALDMEEYLLGVVPAEIGNAPLEACKAQAVAARSFGFVRASAGVIDDTTMNQAYRAPRSVHPSYPNAHQAVKETAGQMLYYNGKVATTYYSHSNGGKVMACKEVWSQDIPYLVSKFDPWTTEPKNGHGVGMSQMGAVRAAESGLSYREILAFYYPGTSLSGELEEPVQVSYQATVNTKNPLSLNLWADTNKSKSLKLIPRGDVVAVLSEINPTWAVIEHGGMQGYADRQYLVKVENPPAPEPIDEAALWAELEAHRTRDLEIYKLLRGA